MHANTVKLVDRAVACPCTWDALQPHSLVNLVLQVDLALLVGQRRSAMVSGYMVAYVVMSEMWNETKTGSLRRQEWPAEVNHEQNWGPN